MTSPLMGDPNGIKVTVDFTMDAEACEWVISDEGDGFDWRSVQNPIEDEDLFKAHGRGIFLARFQFDELEYLGNGNTVRVNKKR